MRGSVRYESFMIYGNVLKFFMQNHHLARCQIDFYLVRWIDLSVTLTSCLVISCGVHFRVDRKVTCNMK